MQRIQYFVLVSLIGLVPAVVSAGVVNDASLVLHFDAQDLDADGVTNDNPSNGAAISAWNDLSSNTHDLDNATGIPTYRVGTGPNALNYVEFDRNGGSADERLFTTDSITAPQMLGTTKKTFSTFMVIRYHSGVLYWDWRPSGPNRYSAEGNNRLDFPPSIFNGTVSGWSSTLTTGGADWHLLEYVADINDTANPNLNDADGVVKVYLDGVLVKIAGMNANVISDLATKPLHIGGYSGGTNSLSAVVDFAEIAHYNKALSDTERGQVGSFLADKYGLTTTYVPEPATLAIVGFGGLMMISRRHRKA